jgi:hypothetical protein
MNKLHFPEFFLFRPGTVLNHSVIVKKKKRKEKKERFKCDNLLTYRVDSAHFKSLLITGALGHVFKDKNAKLLDCARISKA